MKTKYGTYYKCATGSITDSYYLVWRWTVPVYPTGDGELWTYDPDTGRQVIIKEGDYEK